MVSGEPVCAASLHFVPFAKEVPRAVIDMLIDRFIRRGKGAIGEVRGPTAQKAVQSRSHFRPCALVARRQQRADFRLDPPHALLGRACAQIPAATFGKMAWSQRIAKEVEAIPPGVLHRGFRVSLSVSPSFVITAFVQVRASSACWSHVRRQFYDIQVKTPAPIATEALVRIAPLYAVEADIRGLSADERRQARQRRTKPLVDDLRLWLEAQLAAVSGKSTIAGALRYVLSPIGR